MLKQQPEADYIIMATGTTIGLLHRNFSVSFGNHW
jgi:hypothetical protein